MAVSVPYKEETMPTPDFLFTEYNTLLVTTAIDSNVKESIALYWASQRI